MSGRQATARYPDSGDVREADRVAEALPDTQERRIMQSEIMHAVAPRGWPKVALFMCLATVHLGLAWNTANADTSTWDWKANGAEQRCQIVWPNNRRWNQGAGIRMPCPGGPDVLTAPSNWSTDGYPDNRNGVTYDVVIDQFPAVELTIPVTIDTLRLEAPGELDILQGGRLQVALGRITVIGDPAYDPNTGDGGNIRLLGQRGNPATTAEVVINGNTSLLGNGDLQFSSAGGNLIRPLNSGLNALNDVLTVGPEFTIKNPGSETHGLISVLMTNDGTINANGPQSTSSPNSMGRVEIDYSGLAGRTHTLTNDGLLIATDGGKLTLRDVRVDNAGGSSAGTIRVDAGSTLELDSSTTGPVLGQTSIVGGTIEGPGTVLVRSGQINFDGSASGGAGAVTINDTTVNVEDLRKLRLNGRINNNGKIQIFGNTSGSVVAKLQPNGNVSLSGNGEIEFSSGIYGMITHGTSSSGQGDILTLGSGQTVQTAGAGTAGTIGLKLINDGVIDSRGGNIDIDYQRLPGSVNSLTNNGELRATNGGTLEFTDVTVNNNGPDSIGTLIVRGSGSTIVLDNSNTPGKVTSIMGGSINGDGAVIVRGSDVTLDGSTGTGLSINAPTITMDSGRRLRLMGRINNEGTVQLAGDNNGPNEVRIKDNVTVAGGGEMKVSGTGNNIISQGGVANDLTLTLDGGQTLEVAANSRLELRTGLANRANLTVDGSLQLTGSRSKLSNGGGGTLQGTGVVRLNNGTLFNSGTLAPGSSAGELRLVDGSFEQFAAGTLDIEIGGDVAGSGYDSLRIEGNATLEGMLAVSLIDGYVPSMGQQFSVLSAASVIDNGLSLSGADASLFELIVDGTGVLLEYGGLAADFDGDGDVDGEDFLRWQASFGVDDGGDADGDGDTDGEDFLAWQSRFGTALATGGGAKACRVPEPSAAVLLLALTGLLCWDGRLLDRRAAR